ncbi:FHA domain-containing protein [Paenibacillus fonticola]|uniref:FHA domain-containing protein n=1 Tax=Paenibacillus fonticola TaxID=379896 RepID=UPI00036221FE|nr:FHA domain-containing protein [Paenibacillus fonticola]
MKPENYKWSKRIDVLIYAILAGMMLYGLLRPLHYTLQMFIVVVSAVIASFLIWTGGRAINRSPEAKRAIAKIVLLDDDGERLKEWYVKGETSVLIGKSTPRGEVDIDLTDCEYASLVSSEHAVLNRVGDQWFIEDADSHSGTGIRKAGRSEAKQLVAEEPVEIGMGDLIFIANTRLLIK